MNIKTHCFGVVHGTGHGEEKCPPLCVESCREERTKRERCPAPAWVDGAAAAAAMIHAKRMGLA